MEEAALHEVQPEGSEPGGRVSLFFSPPFEIFLPHQHFISTSIWFFFADLTRSSWFSNNISATEWCYSIGWSGLLWQELDCSSQGSTRRSLVGLDVAPYLNSWETNMGINVFPRLFGQRASRIRGIWRRWTDRRWKILGFWRLSSGRSCRRGWSRGTRRHRWKNEIAGQISRSEQGGAPQFLQPFV